MTTSGGLTGVPEHPQRRAGDRSRQVPEAKASPSREDTGRLLHEGQVYRLELEMQNEELRRSHSTLEERGLMLDLFFRNSPPAIAMFDREMRYLHASSRWLEDYRLGRADLMGRSHYEVFPEIPEAWKEIHRRCLAGATECCAADPFPRQDGSTDWVKWEIRPWRNGAGEIGGIIIMSEMITDRKNDEAALRETGERYRTLFRHASEGIFTLTLDGALIEVNEALARMHGYTVEEMQGMHLLDFVTPECPILDPGAIAGILAGGSLTFEADHLHRDGHRFRVEGLASVVQVGGRPVIHCFNRDIAERRRAEQELRGSHALMERAEKLAHSGNWEMNLATRSIRVSMGAGLIYGVSRTEWSLEEVQAFVLPEYRAMLDAALGDLVRNRKPYDVKFRITRPADGQLRDIHSIAEFDPGKGLVFGVIYDITQRHRLEAALETRVLALARPVEDLGQVAFEDLFNLHDLQRLQDGFANATGVASIITRPDGTPLTRPSNFTRLCALIRKTAAGCAHCFESDAALGRHQADGPIVRKCLSGGLWDAGSTILVGGHPVAHWLIGQVWDESQSLEAMAAYAREIGVDQAAFMEALDEVPVMSAGQFQKVAHALFTLASHLSTSAHQNIQQARLIADLHGAEARIRRMADGLERRVKARTAQLVAANSELEAFSYSVSHDLRAPLRSIDGFSQVLLEDYGGRLDETGRQHLQRIRKGAGRMGQLIDDLLHLSRIGREKLNLETVDLSGLSGKVLGELTQAEPQRRVEVVVQPALRLQADRRLAEVMLENLLRNAWKFTQKQPDPRIVIGEKLLPGGEKAIFVQDNGDGFDMAQADKLFKPFQRLHSASDYEGTGIGLAIVRRIIQHHGGRVWAQAEPGRGATFFFTIPEQTEAPAD